MNRCGRNIFTALSVVLALASSAPAAPVDVVFGNLGPNGINALAPSTNAGISNTTWLMHGFTVGGTRTILQNVKLGLADNDNTSATVSIFADAGGVPTGSALGTQSATVNSNTPYLQTFNFGNVPLTSGSSYWIVVSSTTPSTLFNWVFNNDGDFPTTQNTSGWNPLSPVTKLTEDSGATWATSGLNRPAAISITAVPEPATIGMGIAGLAVAGYTLARRRMRNG